MEFALALVGVLQGYQKVVQLKEQMIVQPVIYELIHKIIKNILTSECR